MDAASASGLKARDFHDAFFAGAAFPLSTPGNFMSKTRENKGQGRGKVKALGKSLEAGDALALENERGKADIQAMEEASIASFA